MASVPEPVNPEPTALGIRVAQTIASLMQPRQMKVKGLCAEAGLTYNSFRERYNAGTVTLDDLDRIAPVFSTTPSRILDAAEGFHLRRKASLTVIEGGKRTTTHPSQPPLLSVVE